jgi:hypothetical protein
MSGTPQRGILEQISAFDPEKNPMLTNQDSTLTNIRICKLESTRQAPYPTAVSSRKAESETAARRN